jgi:hypothetical protein
MGSTEREIKAVRLFLLLLAMFFKLKEAISKVSKPRKRATQCMWVKD